MKPARDPMGTAEGRAMLDQLPDLYFAILKSARIEQLAGAAGIRCSFDLPVLGKQSRTAPTAREAIRAALIELSEVLTKSPPHSWPENWHNLALSLPTAMESERFQSKVRQTTVGVTMPSNLKLALQGIADQQEMSFAEVARHLACMGFEDFDERSFSESSEHLLSALSSEVSQWRPSENEQVMVRLDQHLAVRIRSAAKEYCRSASEFGAMCLAHGVFLQTQLAETEQKVASVRGPAVRQLAPKVGLGHHVALLSGILAGSIVAPKKVLKCLSEEFDTPEFVLAAFFKAFFNRREIPAFKAINSKPLVFRSVTTWEEAVKSVDLPSSQAKELLALDE